MGQDEAKELINAGRFSLRGLCCAVAAMLAGPLGAENGYSTETSREVIYEVNSYRVPCVGVAPMSCLQIRREDQADDRWRTFYSQIRGFEYRPGYLYRLRVLETPLPPEQVPADASSIQFDLVDVIDKMPDPRLALHDIWALVRMSDSGSDAFAPDSVPKQPYIEFNVSRSAYLGNTGCGEFSGEILRIGPQELRLGPMMGGIAQPDCDDGSVAARWSGALENVASWQRNKMILVLLDGNGAEVFRYRKID